MRKLARSGVVAALLLGALAGCSSGSAATPAPALGGSIWRAVEIDGRAVLGGPPPELRFNGTRIRADGGCNTFSGSFTLEGDRIDFAGLNSTLRMCDGPAGEIETSFLRALIGVTTMSFDDAGDLLLSGETVSVHLVRS
jgi:heat shock protein HslJ